MFPAAAAVKFHSPRPLCSTRLLVCRQTSNMTTPLAERPTSFCLALVTGGNSGRANVLFSHELARRLPTGTTANAFDPGTGLAHEWPALVRFLSDRVLPRMIPLLRRLLISNIHTPAESGAALARLVLGPGLAKTSGRYFESLREIPSSTESDDQERAAELWRASAALTGVAEAADSVNPS